MTNTINMRLYKSFLLGILPVLLMLSVVSCSSEKEGDLVLDCSDSGLSIEILDQTNVSCETSGSVTATASGGEEGYMYSLNGGPMQSSGNFQNLASGSYSIEVIDANDCSSSVSVDISQADGSIALNVGETTPATCGLPDGVIEINASGGDGSFEYKIEGGDFQDSNIFSGLAPGGYTFTVMDGAGCSSTISAVLESLSGDLTLSVVSTQGAGCGTSNGSVELSASGGDGSYMFQVGTGSLQSSSTFNSLAQGSFEFTVVDGSSCSTSISQDVSAGVTLTNDVMPIINANCSISGCHNGSQSPNLSTKSQIVNSAARVKARTANRTMPLGGTLSQTEIDLIACWVDDGAMNN